MGSKWFTGGVAAAPHGRIQFDFMFEGVRYRPFIRRPPSEANLRRARERLEEIQRQIDAGTFSFAEEFPDYRFLRRLTGVVRVRSCSEVFDEFLAHCEGRLIRLDLATATLSSDRRVLNGVWRPRSRKSSLPSSALLQTRRDRGQQTLEQKDMKQCHQHPSSRVRFRLSRSSRAAQSRSESSKRAPQEEGSAADRPVLYSGCGNTDCRNPSRLGRGSRQL